MTTACGAPIAPLQLKGNKVLTRLKRAVCASATKHDYSRLSVSSVSNPPWAPRKDRKGQYIWAQCDQQDSPESSLDGSTEKLDLDVANEKKQEPASYKGRENLDSQAREKHEASRAKKDEDCVTSEATPLRLSISSHETSSTECSDRTITPGTIEFHVIPEPVEPESPLDPFIASNAFSAPMSQYSTRTPSPNPSPAQPNPTAPKKLAGATSMDTLLEAFPMPNKLRASHCVQLMDVKRAPLERQASLHHIPPRRSRLFLRPTSQGTC